MIKVERIDDEKKDIKSFDITIRIRNTEYTKKDIAEQIRDGGMKQTSTVVEVMLKELANIIEQS